MAANHCKWCGRAFATTDECDNHQNECKRKNVYNFMAYRERKRQASADPHAV